MGMILMSASLFLLVNIPAGPSYQWMYYVGWGMAGLGAGVSGPAYQSLISKAVPQKLRGLAFGLFSTSLGVISLPAPWIGGQMWQRFGPTVPFTVTAVVIFLSVIPIWLKFKLPKTVEQPEEEVPVEDSVAVATG
jgi:MFS family permease